MKREIKFRAWDKVYKEMVPMDIEDSFLVHFTNGGIYCNYKIGAIKRVPDNEIELMQYTGLTDKNGKEIYEGDIIKWTSKDNEIVDSPLIVEFLKDHWAPSCGCSSNSGFWDDCEIIGNIYENPELLGEK